MMNDLVQILEKSDNSLKSMQVTLEHMAVENGPCFDFVHSKEYENICSVRIFFRRLAPHLKPLDCSLLRALVRAAQCEEAMQRLNDYLHATNNVVLTKASEESVVPSEPDHMLQYAGTPDSVATPSIPTTISTPVISSQPTADPDAVPVEVTVESDVDEVTCGLCRGMQSLLCGMFRVFPFSLQYDGLEPGSVIIKWSTSKRNASRMQAILLDDGDLKLLLRENIVSIRVGKEYTVIVGEKEYWMVSIGYPQTLIYHFCTGKEEDP